MNYPSGLISVLLVVRFSKVIIVEASLSGVFYYLYLGTLIYYIKLMVTILHILETFFKFLNTIITFPRFRSIRAVYKLNLT